VTEPTPLEAELLRAIALAWHELGLRCPVRASVAHEYLGDVIHWAVQCRTVERESAIAAAEWVDEREGVVFDETQRMLADYLAGR
jgi:hypothetical protein